MALRLIHVIDSPHPLAGQIHSVLPELLDSLLELDVEGDLLSIDDYGAMSVRRWRPKQTDADWSTLPVANIPEFLEGTNLIHFHGIRRSHFKPLFEVLQRSKTPYLISPHGSLLPNPWKRVGLVSKIKAVFRSNRRYYRNAASLHAVIPEEKLYLSEKNLNSNIATIPWGVPVDDNPPSDSVILKEAYSQIENKRCLMFLGPIDPLEGLVPMLKACEEVLYEAQDWHLILAGNKSRNWFEMIRAAVERRNLSDRVTFVLDPDPAMQKALLRHCEVVIQPSLMNQSPISALLGLANETPCIVSKKCGLKDVNEISSGWEVEPNHLSLSRTLDQVVDSSTEELRQMGIRGSQWVRSHRSWDVLASLYKDHYLSLTA